MSRNRLIAFLLLASLAAGAQSGNAPSRLDYSAFRIIADRNIFNPHRYARTLRSAGPARRAARVDDFALVGTITYAKGSFAFFDSPDADYKKVVEAGQKIANYTVAAINPQSVTLDDAGKPLEMKIGAQMRREDGGKWQLSLNTELPVDSNETAESASNPSPADTGSGMEMNDVLKKLMQQREQESK